MSTIEKNIKTEVNIKTMDALIWTKEFLEVFQKAYPDIYPICISQESFDNFSGFIHSWFCNLIMTGYDHANWQRDKQYIYILQSNCGAIVQIWNHGAEPLEIEMREAYKTYLKCEELPDVRVNCTLYRYNKKQGLQCWNGEATEETKYNWQTH